MGILFLHKGKPAPKEVEEIHRDLTPLEREAMELYEFLGDDDDIEFMKDFGNDSYESVWYDIPEEKVQVLRILADFKRYYKREGSEVWDFRWIDKVLADYINFLT